jgi:hypothetical protein
VSALSTLIRIDQVPAADRLEFAREMNAAIWVPVDQPAAAAMVADPRLVPGSAGEGRDRDTDGAAPAHGVPRRRAADAPAWAWASVVSGVVPLMERFGIATRAEVDPATLASRLRHLTPDDRRLDQNTHLTTLPDLDDPSARPCPEFRREDYHRRVNDELFVPEGFAVPDGLTAEEFRLVPLGPQHNESDYAAWTTSIDHIQATPGFAGHSWPHEMSLADNLRDLEQHAQDFAARRGFTYTVLSTSPGDVIGCVYIYPSAGRATGSTGRRHAVIRSWVRADHPALDPVLHDAVLAWLERDWPFDSIEYAPRT